jgi:hypothetical protein
MNENPGGSFGAKSVQFISFFINRSEAHKDITIFSNLCKESASSKDGCAFHFWSAK